jgi:hypothetical protein
MAVVSDLLLEITAVALLFLATEVLELLLVVREEDYGWKWRFGEAEDYPELNPFVDTWKIAVAIFVIVILPPAIVGYFFWSDILRLMASFSGWWLLLVVSVLFSFWWIWHHVIGKDWNIPQGLLVIASIAFLLLFLWLNFTGGSFLSIKRIAGIHIAFFGR